MPRPKANQQIDLQSAILAVAWKQMSELGASSLTLRGIARELRITAPAIYNYFASRDELVTALIIEAYQEFGDAQLASIADLPAGDFSARLRATGAAYRQWAITHPQRYQLIFGTPIPGYHAPIDRVMPVAARSLTALVGVLESARLAGVLIPEGEPRLDDALRQQLGAWRQMHPVGDVYVLYLALVIWSRVHGLVMIEISNQYPPFLEDPAQIYRRELELLIQQVLWPVADTQDSQRVRR